MYVIWLGESRYIKSVGHLSTLITNITNATRYLTKEEAEKQIKLSKLRYTYLQVKAIEVDK